MKPVPAFTQQCLLTEDCYVLDCYNEIYIWVGVTSNKFEKRGAYSNAAKYIEALNDGRNKDSITLVEVNPTQEPPLFKIQFPVWDDNYSKKWIDTEPFAKLMAANKTPETHDESPFKGCLDPATNKFPYIELKGIFPKGVKVDKKEAYLTDEEFVEVFKMERAAFEALKHWKQQDLKKKVNLFWWLHNYKNYSTYMEFTDQEKQ